MRIIIAGAHEFPEGGGGAPRCMGMLAKGFASQGHFITIMTTLGSQPIKYYHTMGGFYARSFGKIMGGEKRIRAKYKLIKAHFLLLLQLLRLTFERKYDLVLFYGPVLQFPLVGLLARLMKRKTVYFMSDIQPRSAKRPFTYKIKCLFADYTDCILARLSNLIVVLGTSVLQKRYSLLAPKTKQVRIWAPTDTQIFNVGDGERFKNRYVLHGRKIVSYAGSLDTLEGVDLLMKAIRLIANIHPEVVLVIAGNESKLDRVVGERVNFRRIAFDIGVENRVIFTGHLLLHELIDLFAASDILVAPKIDHPMNRVASPIKIAEYLASGRAVISSRICELELCLQHMENIIFCEPGNVKQLVENINKLLADADLRAQLGRNAAEIAKRVFDCRISAKQILENI